MQLHLELDMEGLKEEEEFQKMTEGGLVRSGPPGGDVFPLPEGLSGG